MAISAADFAFICQLVQDRAAIILDDNKQYFVESRIMPLLDELDFENISELISKCRADATGVMKQKVTEAITIHETSFFRDLHPFKALKDVIVPQLMQKRGTAGKSLNIWCGACSSGQEPYTIAIMLRENFPELRDWSIRFIATDISQKILDRAKLGVYSQLEINRGLPAPLLLKYFEKHGLEWQVKADIRSRIEFRQLNLVETWPPLPKMDIIFLRNVLIYFGVPTKRAILGNIRQLMRPDAYLFLGAAEMPMSVDNAYERVDIPRAGCYKLRNQ